MILNFDSYGLGMSLRRFQGFAQRGALSATQWSLSESKKNASGPVLTASLRRIMHTARTALSSHYFSRECADQKMLPGFLCSSLFHFICLSLLCYSR